MNENFKRGELSGEDLGGILARCEAATPGPWESFVEGRDHVAGDSFIRRGGMDDHVSDLYLSPWKIEDQDFIAAARQDIPRLVAEVLRLRALVGRGRSS
jgi:hypothetical protein